MVVLVTTLAVLLTLYLLYRLQTIIRWCIIALFLAVALNPAVNWLHHRRVPRALAILVVYLALLIGLAGLGTLLLPPLVVQVQQLAGYIGHLIQQPGGLTGAVQKLANQYGLGGYVQTLRAQLNALPGQLGSALGSFVAVTSSIVGSLVALGTIMVLTFFLLHDGARLVEAGLGLCPEGQRAHLRRLLSQSAGAISGYISGNVAISVIAGIFVFVGMTVLAIPYALALAILLAVVDLIPMVGATLGAIPPVIVAFAISPLKAIILVIYIIAYQQIESNVLQPVIYSRSVRLPALAVFLAVLAGGTLMGILGALIAIPVAEIIRILGADWLASRARKTATQAHAPPADDAGSLPAPGPDPAVSQPPRETTRAD
jgi:predicted PurR-regulated permease PerM